MVLLGKLKCDVMNEAVLVGYNLYKYSPDDTLRGCANDANNLRRLIETNLRFAQVQLLLDAKSSAEIEMASVWRMVTSQTGPPSRLIWSHSSHGTNNPDSSQRDGLEELLCCYDTRADKKTGLWVSGVISAKLIGELAAQVRPIDTLDIILDCCNAPAGDQLKAVGRSYNRAKFMPRSVVGVPVRPKTVQAVRSTIPINVALWSACEPSQTSSDSNIDGSWQGAFTAAFLKAFKVEKSRADIITGARNWLKSNGFRQNPHLYCWKEMAQGRFGE